jgi:glycosyltransferase involved in cell wall biosynthesis
MKSDNSLVSIITPCFNSARFISQSIESVLNQTYKYFEMIIVDDCSTDGSNEIIKKYCRNDSRIKYYKTKFTSGSPTIPRNIGIEKAKGRYIAFIDSDDIWLPSKLETQIKLFNSYKVAIVFSYYEKISETKKKKNHIITSPSSITYYQLLKGNCIGCLTAIYDTEKAGKSYFQSIGHEDYLYWLLMLRSGYIACNTNTVEALYRVRANSISRNKIQSSIWTWNIYRKYLKLGINHSIYYYFFYLFNAILKYIK